MFAKAFLGIFILVIGLGYMERVSTGSKLKEHTATKIKILAQNEEALVGSIIRYIDKENIIPTMEDLASKYYFSDYENNNGFGGTFSFTVNRDKATIDVSTTFETSEQALIYSKLYSRTFKGIVSDKTVTTKHLIPNNSISNTDIRDTRRTYIGDNAPDMAKYTFWIDTSSNPAIKKVSSGTAWNILETSLSAIKTLKNNDVVSGVSRLSDEGASSGDIKYVYNSATNTIDEYVYYNNNWALNGGANGDTTVTDIEGHIYKPVVVGNQTWLDRNMRTKYYPDGTLIIHPYDYNINDSFTYTETEKDSNIESNESDSVNDTYGYLYQRYSAISHDTAEYTRGICPYGYHIPSTSDFNTLFHYLDSTYEINATSGNNGTVVGEKVREGGVSGLNFTMGGYRSTRNYDFYSKDIYGYYRTSTVNYIYRLHYTADYILMGTYNDKSVYSVRCMKDQRNLLDINDIFGDGSIIGTWQLNGNGDELGGNYTSNDYGVYGSAYYDDGFYIDGESRSVRTTFNPHTDADFGDNHEFSLSFWVYLNSDVDNGASRQYFLTNRNGTTDNEFDFYYRVSDNKLCWRIDTVLGSSTSTLSKEIWHHIIYTYDKTDIKIYIDTILDVTENYTGNGEFKDNTVMISINDFEHYLRGKMDQVRLFNRVLTSQEVLILYSEKKTK